MTSEQRKALLWIKEHQPTPWRNQEGGPSRTEVYDLRHNHLIEPHGRRGRNRPMTFVLSPAGKRALESSDGKEAS